MVSRAMLIFQKKGDIRNMLKLYRLLIEPEETDLNKILSAIEKKTGVKLTKEQLYAPEITEALKVDMLMKRRLQVTGTPTIFLDGKWDRLRKGVWKVCRKLDKWGCSPPPFPQIFLSSTFMGNCTVFH